MVSHKVSVFHVGDSDMFGDCERIIRVKEIVRELRTKGIRDLVWPTYSQLPRHKYDQQSETPRRKY